MFPSYSAYRWASTGVFLFLLPAASLYFRFAGRQRETLAQRLGRYPDAIARSISGQPRLWFHAASVGEVTPALAVIDVLSRRLPGSRFFLSTTTTHGQAFARERVGPETHCIFAPVDFIPAVRSALTTIRPDLLVLLETEIWPNWLMQAGRMGIRTALVNGRISERSIRRYVKVRGIMKTVLNRVDAFSMITASDAQRIRQMGAPAGRITVNGNAKYDQLISRADPAIVQEMARFFGIERDAAVLVAGSTRHPEEAIFLDVYARVIERFPKTVLIMAPRHVQRAVQIRDAVVQKGYSCQLRSELEGKRGQRTASVIVLDTIGELSAIYGLASVVFCGGSLVPLGGQNVLEAAVWGKPVIYGPSMSDFQDAKMLLETTGGGIEVADGRALADRVVELLARPEQAAVIGQKARQAVASHQGAAQKHADVICSLL